MEWGMGAGGGTLSSTPWGGPDLPGLFTEMPVVYPVTVRGMPGEGVKSDQHTDSIYAPPRAGKNCDLRGG